MTVSGERRLERSSSVPSSRPLRHPSSRYGYSQLTPILIFDKVAKSTSQVTENGWDVTTYQYQSGGYSQVTLISLHFQLKMFLVRNLIAFSD